MILGFLHRAGAADVHFEPHRRGNDDQLLDEPAGENHHGGGGWTKTYKDGLGRTVKLESGEGGVTKSVVETLCEVCACSPRGKAKTVSQPYKPRGDPMAGLYSVSLMSEKGVCGWGSIEIGPDRTIELRLEDKSAPPGGGP